MPIFPPYTLVAGDGTRLNVTCQDAGNNNAPINLTSMTVSLIYRISNGTAQTRAMTIDSATAGTAHYIFQPTDLTPGMMEATVQIKDASNNVVTQLQPFQWEVRPSPLV